VLGYLFMVQNQHIYQVYKSLRNYLRKLSVDDSFFVIWNYVQYLQFGKKISELIEVNPALVHLKNTKSWRPNEWELELLAKEIIINSQGIYSSQISLKKWSHFYNVLSKLRNLRDEIAKAYIDQYNVMTELYRIAHRQFPWQSRPGLKFLFRYYKIFSIPKINDIVQNIIGINVRDLYIIGLAFIAIYSEKPEILLPLKLELEKVDIDLGKVNKFLDFTSEKPSILKEKMLEEQEFNDKFEYTYNHLRAYPIVRMAYRNKDSLVCPLLTLLFWRITSGLYYEICDKKDFGDNFGVSFQKYVGNVIEEANNNKTINFIKEEEYYVSKNRKDTVDWIVYDRDSALFIECKTKRMILPAKIELKDSLLIEEELNNMAKFILQLYKTITDYYNNRYSSFEYKKEMQIYPLILTMEDWFLFGRVRLDILKKMIIKEFNKINLPLEYLEKIPYSICSVEEFESIIQITQITGIKEFMSKKVFNKEKKEWLFHDFIQNEFPEEIKKCKFLFKEESNKIFSLK
jgi:hypothetical protein